MSISTIWKMVVAVEVLVAKASWQLLNYIHCICLALVRLLSPMWQWCREGHGQGHTRAAEQGDAGAQ